MYPLELVRLGSQGVLSRLATLHPTSPPFDFRNCEESAES
jgi:hypothetical protein